MSSVLIDTNLLVMLLIGMACPHDLGSGVVGKYAVEDFELLNDQLGAFDHHVSIPNILSETSDILNLGRRARRRNINEAFRFYCASLDEIFVPSSDAVDTPAYWEHGLPDAAIVLAALNADAAGRRLTVLTDDGPLYGFLAGTGFRVSNFSHLRTPPGYQ